jgi:hypothetical protein
MNFHETMLKKLGKRKTEKITKAVKDYLTMWMKSDTDNNMGINHADYCNAFGIMQGVAYALGYEHAAITTKEDMPGFWFDKLIEEMENELAIYHKNLSHFLGD